MSKTVSPDGLAAEVIEMLNKYAEDITDDVIDAVELTAKECVSEIKAASPVGESVKHYKLGWRKKVTSRSPSKKIITVYNAKKPGLAHLLEYGHAKRDGGRVVGIPHIKPAEVNAEKKLIKRIEKAVRDNA